jgi:hypothetical protein
MHETTSKTVKIISSVIIGIVIILVVWLVMQKSAQAPAVIENEPIISNTELPQVTNPETFSVAISQNSTVSAGQTISGSVPGFWFFEGSFPVSLVDNNDNVFGTVIATSTSDWMTSDIIPFTITLPTTLSYTGPGKIVFTRDDPSDGESSIPLSETTATIPVIFQ